jgi:hypothetical protein
MNEFESQLQKQVVRQAPGHWRKQILDAARRNAELPQTAGKPSWSWRDLLWPCPQAWAGLAAAWLLVLGFNLLTETTPAPSVVAQKAAPAGLDGYGERQRLLAELLDDNRGTPAPEIFVPRRRSEAPLTSVAV